MNDVFPSADAVAVAIIAACYYTGDDPLQYGDGSRGLRSAFYAYAALARLYPECPNPALGRCLGRDSYSACQLKHETNQARKAKWWSEKDLCEVVLALEEFLGIRVREAAPPVPLLHQAPPAAPTRIHHPMRTMRAIDRCNPVDLGDPPPGRSALDQRRSVR